MNALFYFIIFCNRHISIGQQNIVQLHHHSATKQQGCWIAACSLFYAFQTQTINFTAFQLKPCIHFLFLSLEMIACFTATTVASNKSILKFSPTFSNLILSSASSFAFTFEMQYSKALLER